MASNSIEAVHKSRDQGRRWGGQPNNHFVSQGGQGKQAKDLLVIYLLNIFHFLA